MRMPRAELLLPVVIIIASILLISSEFMTTFELTPPGGEPLDSLQAADRHGYALLVLGILAIAATVVAVLAGSRPAALTVAAAAGIALLIFLTLDLPDVNKVGPIDQPSSPFTDAQAKPQSGFWLQTFSTLILALGAGTFATLTAEQLAAPARKLGLGLPGSQTDDGPDSGETGYQR